MSYFYLVQKDIQNQGLAVVLASNPRNPTGQVNDMASSGNVIELVLIDNDLYLPGHQVSLFMLYVPHWTNINKLYPEATTSAS